MKTKKQVLKFIFSALVVALAGVLAGITFKNFFEPLNLVPTGMSGLSLLISTWMGGALPTSIIYLFFNVILITFAFKIFGWKFIALTGIGLGCYTAGMQFGKIPALTDALVNTEGSYLLCTIVGAVFIGLCLGVALRFGGSTGGSDILGNIINRHFPKIKVGTCTLAFNALVITLNLFTNPIHMSFYSLIEAVLCAMAMDMVLDKSKKIVAFHIVCDKPKEIAQAIFKTYHRGVTELEATGMYTGKKKSTLICLVPYDQSYKLKEFVLTIDETAFVFSTPVTETIGEGLLWKLPDEPEENLQGKKERKKAKTISTPKDTTPLPAENPQVVIDETKPIEEVKVEKEETKTETEKRSVKKSTTTKKTTAKKVEKTEQPTEPSKPKQKKTPTKKKAE